MTLTAHTAADEILLTAIMSAFLKELAASLSNAEKAELISMFCEDNPAELRCMNVPCVIRRLELKKLKQALKAYANERNWTAGHGGFMWTGDADTTPWEQASKALDATDDVPVS